jgi:hypothetical protein
VQEEAERAAGKSGKANGLRKCSYDYDVMQFIQIRVKAAKTMRVVDKSKLAASVDS